MNNTAQWMSLFLGREAELQQLRRAWQRACSGQPQVQVVLADSGYGKTKLVQALYSHLSTHEDPAHYWPDTLLSSGQSLRVMPDMGPSGPAAGVEMPWFWWGVRWPDPAAHNAREVSGALLESRADPTVDVHLMAVHQRLERKAAMSSAGISMGKALLALVPGAATLSALVSASLDILEAYRIGKDYRGQIERASSQERVRKEHVARILALLVTVFEVAGADKDGLPMVLFLDDAQWLDALTATMLAEIWQVAQQRRWRLLIVATHWEREWQLHDASGRPSSEFARWFHGLTPVQAEHAQVLPLTKLPEDHLGTLLKQALPGLSAAQQAEFLQRASGNPRYIVELALYLRDRPEYFVNEDVSGAISPQGHEAVRNALKLSIDELEQRRFNQASDEVKRALGISSLQGDRFTTQFTLDVAERLAADHVTREALHASEKPFVLAASVDALRMEFRSRAIHQRSSEFAQLQFGSAMGSALLDTVLAWIGAGTLQQMPPASSFQLLRTAMTVACQQRDLARVSALLDVLLESAVMQASPAQLAGVDAELDALTDAMDEDDEAALAAVIVLQLQLLEATAEMADIDGIAQRIKRIRRLCRGLDVAGLHVRLTLLEVQALYRNGQLDKALQVADAALRMNEDAVDLETGRLLLLEARCLLATGASEKAADRFMEAFGVLESADRKYGPHAHAAAEGVLMALVTDISAGGNRWNRQHVQRQVDYLRASSRARLLGASLPYAGNAGRPPEWVAASMWHDLGMAELVQSHANTLLGRSEWASDEARSSLASFEHAQAGLQAQGIRPDLLARTCWVTAGAHVLAGSVPDDAVLEAAQSAVERLVAVRGAQHPESRIAAAVVAAARTGEREQLPVRDLLDHGWNRIDYDLQGPDIGRPKQLRF